MEKLGDYRVILLAALLVPMLCVSSAMAARFTSTSYIIDASVNDSFGGQDSSTSYKVTASGGNSLIGDGAGGSYKIGAGYTPQLNHGMQLTVQPGGLMAYYPLDETTMPAIYDNSANSVTGVAAGTPTSAAGKIGTALVFNGSNQYVQLGTSSSLQGTALTLESWVKTSTASGAMAAIAKGNSFWLGVNAGKAAIYDWTGATFCSAGTTISDGTWHHIAATLNSGASNGSILYVDGIQQQACTWTPTAQTGQPGIGAANTGSWTQFFNGQLDTAKVFSRILTANEIKAEYDAQNAGNAAGVHIGNILSGTSNTALYDAVVRTDAAGYNLAVSQNQDLTSGGATIPAVSGSIASPVTWTEGATKGLGFTLYNTNASAIPGKWSSGAAYAAFPGSSTSFYTRSGYTAGAKDYLNMRLRLDVAATQLAASYQNSITLTGTMLP